MRPCARSRAPGSTGSDLDLIVTATASPDYYFPATATLIGERIGARGVAAYDLSAACTGFVYALAQAYGQLTAGLADTVLVVGTEVFSRLLDWGDRSTCVLFGDGAGAVVLAPQRLDDRDPRVRAGLRRVGGRAARGCRRRARTDPVATPYVHMDGAQVYKFATTVSVESATRALTAAGLTVADVDVFVPHQANRRIIDHAARRLGLSEDRVVSNVDRYGNTSAASIPICLDEAHRGRPHQGRRHRPHDGLRWRAVVGLVRDGMDTPPKETR